MVLRLATVFSLISFNAYTEHFFDRDFICFRHRQNATECFFVHQLSKVVFMFWVLRITSCQLTTNASIITLSLCFVYMQVFNSIVIHWNDELFVFNGYLRRKWSVDFGKERYAKFRCLTFRLVFIYFCIVSVLFTPIYYTKYCYYTHCSNYSSTAIVLLTSYNSFEL